MQTWLSHLWHASVQLLQRQDPFLQLPVGYYLGLGIALVQTVRLGLVAWRHIGGAGQRYELEELVRSLVAQLVERFLFWQALSFFLSGVPHVAYLQTWVYAQGVGLGMVFAYALVEVLTTYIAAQTAAYGMTASGLVSFVSFTAKLLKGCIVLYGSVLLCRTLGWDLGPLMTRLSIGLGTMTAVLGFAAKDLINNFFGAVILMVYRPFQQGDWIVVDKVAGRVTAISLRATQVRTGQGSALYVPNATFINKAIDNYGPGMYWSCQAALSLQEGASQGVTAFLQGFDELMEALPYVQQEHCRVRLDKAAGQRQQIVFDLVFKTTEERSKLVYSCQVVQELEKLAQASGVALQW